MDYEEALMIKIAWYYYLEKLTQQKIAELLGISRMRVIKLLDKAHQSGIIQFKIREDSMQHIHLEKELMSRYGLKDAFIVPTPPSPDEVNETIAKAASMYINDRLTVHSFINIGYGDTLSKVLNNLIPLSNQTLSCVSLTGGVNHYFQNMRHNLFNANLYLMPTPLMTSSKEMVEAMKQEPSVQEIASMVKLSSMTVLSIGELQESSTIAKLGILSKSDLLFLKMKGAVGDILSHFIDQNGQLIENPIEDRLMSTPLQVIKELDHVIGVAGGKKKVEAIRAGLRGKYLNVLITDEDTALELIKP